MEWTRMKRHKFARPKSLIPAKIWSNPPWTVTMQGTPTNTHGTQPNSEADRWQRPLKSDINPWYKHWYVKTCEGHQGSNISFSQATVLSCKKNTKVTMFAYGQTGAGKSGSCRFQKNAIIGSLSLKTEDLYHVRSSSQLGNTWKWKEWVPI